MSEKVIAKFKAIDDETGDIHKVLVIRNFIEHKTTSGYQEVPGMIRFETSTGLSAHRVNDETFEIVQTGQRLRKLRKRD